MNADEVLGLLRPLVLVIDQVGRVRAVHGGYGGFLGHDPATFVDVSVFDFVAPSSVGEIATYFAESADESPDTVSLPLPFRLELLAADGEPHPVDVIPTARALAGGQWGWIVTLVPTSLGGSAGRSLDAEVSGQPRPVVRRLLAEEVTVDNAHYSTRGFLIDQLDGDEVVVSGRAESESVFGDALADAISDGWAPWTGLPHGATATLAVDALPITVARLVEQRRWRRVWVTSVGVDGRTTAAFIVFSRVPDSYPLGEVKSNARARMKRLADYTAVILGRWQEQDRLVRAATSDALTGLANRRGLADALAAAGSDHVAVLYIDLDDFKSVNDRFGHLAGDQVLVETARRISELCRPVDVVARFGGDEFVVLLRDAAAEQAAQIGERIMSRLHDPIDLADGPLRITASVGLAPGVSGADLIDLADQAMLAAKRGGRARLIAAPPSP
ncbi:MAG: diguanylate cyclase domain-containing protein [Ilumatobacteraceae bacterium]